MSDYRARELSRNWRAQAARSARVGPWRARRRGPHTGRFRPRLEWGLEKWCDTDVLRKWYDMEALRKWYDMDVASRTPERAYGWSLATPPTVDRGAGQ